LGIHPPEAIGSTGKAALGQMRFAAM
jgi:hypothetical protein